MPSPPPDPPAPLDEDAWIETILQRFPQTGSGILGPGDDAALLPLPADEVAVLTVDTLVDGTHFRPGWITDRELGWRSLAVSLSDLAAMGATPRGAVLAIETPDLPGRLGEAFFAGVEEILGRFDTPLLGGNVTRTDGPLAVSSTLVGSVRPGHELRRDGARPGDDLWVSGVPGRAAEARRRRAAGGPHPEPCPWAQPLPRVALGRLLRSAGVHAAIDLSDGLARDLHRLLEASGVGAEIELTVLGDDAPTLEDILEGGEDYELLFTAGAESREAIADASTRTGGVVHRIGEIVETAGFRLRQGDERLPYSPRGWDPFRGS